MRVLGIDLGTTNTVTAKDAVPVPVPSEHGRTVTPSVVSFLPNGTTQVGIAAKRRRLIDLTNTVFSAKRIIGRRWNDAKMQEFRSNYPFDLVQLEDGTPAFATRAGELTATNIATLLLTSIHKQLRHLSCDAKILDEDPDTGAKKYRYIRTGENHFSMAFTYAWMAAPYLNRVVIA